MYGGTQAAFQHGIAAPFCRPRRDPPPPELERPQRHIQALEEREYIAGGDAHVQRHQADDGRLHRNPVHQRRPRRVVETLRTAEPPHSGDETDAEQREAEQNLSAESDSENQQEPQEEPAGASASTVAANTTQSKTKPTVSDSSKSKTKPLKVNDKKPSKDDKDNKDELRRDSAGSRSQPAGKRPSQTDVQVSSLLNQIHLTNI